MWSRWGDGVGGDSVGGDGHTVGHGHGVSGGLVVRVIWLMVIVSVEEVFV